MVGRPCASMALPSRHPPDGAGMSCQRLLAAQERREPWPKGCIERPSLAASTRAHAGVLRPSLSALGNVSVCGGRRACDGC